MSNFMYENPYLTIIGLNRIKQKKLIFNFKKIEWKEEELEF